MNKGIIIIGKELSGKTRLANDFAKTYNEENVCFIDGKNFELGYKYPFQNCTKETKVLIIDEITTTSIIMNFYNLLSENLIVNKPHEPFFDIKIDKLIIVCTSKIKIKEEDLPQSFLRRFKILKTEQNGTIQ